MKRALLTLTLIALSACSREVNGPQAPGAGLPKSTQESDLTGNGTMQTGGGNGLNGKPLEHYIRDITTLPEYKQHIAPIIRKMSSTKPDGFAAYLDWAARHKAWYFLPVQLPALEKAQIDTFFKSDQLALHSEQRIYIEAPTYVKMQPRDRALLLMHEMVMGARVLMNKKALEQCQTLSKHSELLNCKDQEMERMARQPRVEAGDGILDADDHQRVRAMTAFLMKDGQDLSGPSVAHKRSDLDFPIPWDDVASSLDLEKFAQALERTNLSGERFAAKKPHWSGNWVSDSDTVDCEMKAAMQSSGAAKYLMITPRISARRAEAGTSNSYMSLYRSRIPGGVIHDGNRDEEEKHWFMVEGEMIYAVTIDARGVLDPENPDRVLDRVKIAGNGVLFDADGVGRGKMFEFYITRETEARVIEMRMIPVAVVMGKPSTTPGGFSKPAEYIPLKNVRTTICKPVSPQ